MSSSQSTVEGTAAMVTKAAPPTAVSIASLAGYPISDLVLWATFIYTVLMIGHKLFHIWKDVRSPKGGA
jgi:hypothetical protein